MKDELRKQLKALRRGFDGESRRAADKLIFERFLKEFKDAESFFIYNSFGSEADTAPLISALSAQGKQVFLPRVEGENMVAVPYGKTQRGAYGIEEPVGRAYSGDIQITVIPLLAVNGRGQRIGYGGGYYDRYLKNAKTIKAGLGYSFQMVEFEGDKWDIPLDIFLCESGIYKF